MKINTRNGLVNCFSPTAECFGVFSHSKGFGADSEQLQNPFPQGSQVPSKGSQVKVPRFPSKGSQVKVPRFTSKGSQGSQDSQGSLKVPKVPKVRSRFPRFPRFLKVPSRFLKGSQKVPSRFLQGSLQGSQAFQVKVVKVPKIIM